MQVNRNIPNNSFNGHKVPKPRSLFYNSLRGHFKEPAAYSAKARALLKDTAAFPDTFKAEEAQKQARVAINRGAASPDDILLYGMACVNNHVYLEARNVAHFLNVSGHAEKSEYLLGQASYVEGEQYLRASNSEVSDLSRLLERIKARTVYEEAFLHFQNIQNPVDGVMEIIRNLPIKINSLPKLEQKGI